MTCNQVERGHLARPQQCPAYKPYGVCRACGVVGTMAKGRKI
jgi:hypothetical protein